MELFRGGSVIRELRNVAIGVLFMGMAMSSISYGQTNSDLRAAADALSRAAAECLYDVRDRNLAWERSSNCMSLSTFASRYIALGGFQDETTEVKLVAERARTTAWMARAISLAGRKPISI